MKKILTALILTGILFSCNQPTTETAFAKAPVDSLITNWKNSWNHHDSAGVKNLFATDALLIDDKVIATNANELSDKWIHPNIKVVNHLEATKLQDWSTGDRAGYTGKFQLDVVVNDSVIAKPKGVFTINWVKTDNGDWKITTASIHSF